VKPEIEAKFLDIDHDTLRVQLQKLGATCDQPKRVMRRKNYDFIDKRLDKVDGWVRLRDEGDKITLSYKQRNGGALDDVHEVSVRVSSFDDTDALLTAIGMNVKNYQETTRESWRLDGVEIELDEWPWIKPYIELEGPDEASLKQVAQKLGLDWQDARPGTVAVAYQAEYDVSEDDVHRVQFVSFDTPRPATWEKRRPA